MDKYVIAPPVGSNNNSVGAADRPWQEGDFEKVVADEIIVKGPVVDVRAFGAVGDGVTDDTEAIQTAITTLKNEGKKNLLIPVGTYIISNEIIIDGQLTIWGYGAVIKNVGNTDALRVGTTVASWNGLKCLIKGLTVIGNAQSGNGLQINGMLCGLYECSFRENGLSGIRGQSAQYARIENCAFGDNGRYGIELVHGESYSSNNDIVIQGTYECINNKLGGYYLSASKLFFARNTFTVFETDCAKVGMYAEGYNSIYVNNGFEIFNGGGSSEDVNVVTLAAGTLLSEFCNNIIESAGAGNVTPLRVISGYVKIAANNFNIVYTGHKYIEIDGGEVIEENNIFPNNNNAPVAIDKIKSVPQIMHLKKTITPTFNGSLYIGTLTLNFTKPGAYLVSVYAKAGGGSADHGCQVQCLYEYKSEGNFPVANATRLSFLNSSSNTVYTDVPTANNGSMSININCASAGDIEVLCNVLPLMLDFGVILSQQTDYVS